MVQEYLRNKYLSRVEYLKLPLEERLIKLNKTEDERARELHKKLIMIDIHCHSVIYFPYTYILDAPVDFLLPKNLVDYLKGLRSHTLETYLKYYRINWLGLKESGVTAVFKVLGGASERFDRCLYSLGFSFADVEKNSLGKRAYCENDIMRAKKEGKIAFMAATEGNPFSNVLDRVDILYGLGFRAAGMTYEIGNICGSGGSDPRNTGLSPFGIQVVKKMNELGLIIDLSHAGKKTSMDVIDISHDPVMFSHNGAAGVYPKGGKCLTDEQLMTMAEKHGVVGIEAVPNTLNNTTRQGVKDWFEHLGYCMNLIGVNNIAVGLDIHWQDHVAWHKLSHPERHFPGEYMEGLENPTEAWPNIIRCLVLEGYSDKEIEKIVGGNALRLIKKVIG